MPILEPEIVMSPFSSHSISFLLVKYVNILYVFGMSAAKIELLMISNIFELITDLFSSFDIFSEKFSFVLLSIFAKDNSTIVI